MGDILSANDEIIVGLVSDKIQRALCWSMCQSERHYLCWSGTIVFQSTMGRTVL